MKAWFWMVLALVWASTAWAFEPFVVEDIKLRGLGRVAEGTVFNYFPVKPGDRVDEGVLAAAVRSLFKTGLFKDVRLYREGKVLILELAERPAIAAIKIEGNKDIKTEDLVKALKSVGLAEGQVFNPKILEKVEAELKRQYFGRGKYGVEIKAEVTPITQNRAAILLKITEGQVAKIKQISIVGNQAFDDKTLLEVFELGTTGWLSFYTKNDQYSKQKLTADLERLKSFYLDHGYIRFEIESTQVAITPDKRGIYITVNVREGGVYRLEEVKLTGKLIVKPEELVPLIQLGPGEVYSGKRATESMNAISTRLGDEGYIFANVNIVPEIDDEKKTVKLSFFVDPGRQVYVRRINVKGNSRTQDEVIRRELRQMEAALASTSKIEQSKSRLERLGYFKEVNVETPTVPGTLDLIDVNYGVTERPSGNLSAGIGFSQVQGLIFNASVSQTNFLGTGKQVSFEFNNSQVFTVYRAAYYNPYFTLDGIGAGFDISYRSTDAAAANITSYTTNTFAAGVSGGIPISEFDRLSANLDFNQTTLKTTGRTAQQIFNFIDEFGKDYSVVTASLGWTRDSRDRAIFPTRGGRQSISLLSSIPFGKLKYYKVQYQGQYFVPWTKDLTLALRVNAGYGNGYGGTGPLPFFENFFAGGVQSVRGFRQNTLGPRDSLRNPFGGEVKLVGGADLFFPVPFLDEELKSAFRLGVFFDAGNVFKNSPRFGELRYSAGLSAQWFSPFGPLEVSLAKPLNAKPKDDEQVFQFSFGAGF
ncbi:MAG: outer membrane protein assembly factor BamA [Methylohalobius sp.]|nr:outer membrane protein assembly factor BamA [Methylohalobius sp.]